MSSKNWQLVETITNDHRKKQILNELEKLRNEIENEDNSLHSRTYANNKARGLESQLALLN